MLHYYGTVGNQQDIVPDAFSFTPQTGIALNTTVTSSTVTVAGIDAGVEADISISLTSGNGTLVGYNIEGGSYTTSAGTVEVGQDVTIRMTTHASFNGDTTTIALTINGVSANFQVTAATPAPVFSNPQLEAMPHSTYVGNGGAWAGASISYNTSTSNNILTGGGVAAGGAAAANYLVNTGGTTLTLVPPGDGVMVRVVGTYTNGIYHPDQYTQTATCTWSVEPALDIATGNDNQLCLANNHNSSDLSPLGEIYTIEAGAWNYTNNGVISNSMTHELYPTATDVASFSEWDGSAGSGRDAVFAIMMHQGHPAPSSPGAAGSGSPNLCVMRLNIQIIVMAEGGGSALHTVNVLENCDIHWLPA